MSITLHCQMYVAVCATALWIASIHDKDSISHNQSRCLDILVAMAMTIQLMNGRSEDSDHETAYRAPFQHTSTGVKGPIYHVLEFTALVIDGMHGSSFKCIIFSTHLHMISPFFFLAYDIVT